MVNKVDYLLVLSPPESVMGQVRTDKYQSRKMIGEFESFNSKAHLTMAHYFFKGTHEIEPLIPHLRYKMSTLPPITLDINGYNYFDSNIGKTIYASPTIDSYNEMWFEQMRDHVGGNHIVPHITIAKGISEEKFEALWPKFKDKVWFESFQVDRLTILRRELMDSDSYYSKVYELKFKNDKLVKPFIYKNRKRRIKSRSNISGNQTRLF